MGLRERLIDPNSPDRRPRRAAYVLPSLFTAGNIFLGYLAILRAFQGSMAAASGLPGVEGHFEASAMLIGLAVFLDGLDGTVARMTNTTSEFGREIDSLADVISFGIAPAVLAFSWGVLFLDPHAGAQLRGRFQQVGAFVSFLFLLCGAARLARFNVQKNPVPRNPGRPDRKYFVGLPIPAAAGMVAAIVYATGATPIHYWPLSAAWIALLGLLGFLMVSTWRYYAFKNLHLSRPRSYLLIVVLAALIFAVVNFGQIVLLAMALVYVLSGVAIRVGGLIRRHWRRPKMEQPIG